MTQTIEDFRLKLALAKIIREDATQDRREWEHAYFERHPMRDMGDMGVFGNLWSGKACEVFMRLKQIEHDAIEDEESAWRAVRAALDAAEIRDRVAMPATTKDHKP